MFVKKKCRHKHRFKKFFKIRKYIKEYKFDNIVNCAAITNLSNCETYKNNCDLINENYNFLNKCLINTILS